MDYSLKNKYMETLTFAQAMDEVINGKSISKKEWDNPLIFCCLKEGILMIKLNKGWCSWIISESDMVGNDWYIVEGEK